MPMPSSVGWGRPSTTPAAVGATLIEGSTPGIYDFGLIR